MENRDKDKIGQGSDVSKNLNKSDSSASFGQDIGRSENKLNEPISRKSGSVGSSGMKGDSGRSSADLESSALGASSDKGSQGGSSE